QPRLPSRRLSGPPSCRSNGAVDTDAQRTSRILGPMCRVLVLWRSEFGATQTSDDARCCAAIGGIADIATHRLPGAGWVVHTPHTDKIAEARSNSARRSGQPM